MDIGVILRRQSAMEAERTNFESIWEEASRRLFPRGPDFRQNYAPGSRRNVGQYDSFPMLALHRYAAAMDSGLTPRTTTWHHPRTGESEIDDDEQVVAFLEALNKILWRTRYAPRANFAAQNHEQFMSTGAYGTGVVFIEGAAMGGTRYRFCPLEECYMEKNFFGIVDTVHRKFKMTVRHLFEVFEEERIPEKVHSERKAGKIDRPYTVLHVCMPRADYDPGALDEKRLPWTDIYILLDTKDVLRSGGFHEFPYAINRHAVAPNESYGRGPGTMLLPDIKMLNEMKRTVIQTAQLSADKPLLLANDGILSEFRMVPGAHNFGGLDHNGQRMVEAFDIRADHGIGLELIRDTRDQIDDAFLGVYFRVLLENPQMTATQAMLVAQQQGQMVAPAVGRAQSEYLGPLIRRESGILFRQGRHPPMPEVLAEYLMSTGESLGIEYDSPMTRAVNAEDSVAVLRAIEAMGSIAQALGPGALSRYNPDEIADIVNEANGVPKRALYSLEEMQDRRQQEQQAAELQGLLAAAPVAAQTAESLARAQQAAANVPQAVA